MAELSDRDLDVRDLIALSDDVAKGDVAAPADVAQGALALTVCADGTWMLVVSGLRTA